jgi:hypothetical protein
MQARMAMRTSCEARAPQDDGDGSVEANVTLSVADQSACPHLFGARLRPLPTRAVGTTARRAQMKGT